MISYEVKGIASVHESYEGRLRDLDGIDCEDNFAEYFDYADEFGIISGYMHFVYENSELYTVTVYTCERELTQIEQDALVDYTQGQWSDGIGEGFEQYPVFSNNGEEAYISPWYAGQLITITKVKS